MLQPQSIVTVADNSGGKVARVFKVLGGSHRRYARIGDTVVVSIQTAEPRKADRASRASDAWQAFDSLAASLEDARLVLVAAAAAAAKASKASKVMARFD